MSSPFYFLATKTVILSGSDVVPKYRDEGGGVERSIHDSYFLFMNRFFSFAPIIRGCVQN